MSPADALQRWRTSEKLRFLVVGAWNTAFGYALFLVIYWLAGTWLHYVFVAVLAHLLAVTQSFVAQRTWVFAAGTGWTRQYLRFHVASLAALGTNLATLAFLIEVIALHVLFAQAAATVISVVVTYLLHKHYSFRRRQ